MTSLAIPPNVSQSDLHRLVLGTHNRKKRGELDELLRPYSFQLRTLDDFPAPLQVAETGDSFAANATKKAVEQALHLHAWVLGEDSGLQVDALDGAPGIYSARFAGPEADDQDNNDHLLKLLSDVPPDRRGGRYVCHMTLADPQGHVWIDAEASCRGVIRRARAGTAGFGYDPLFEIPEYHRTFGELGAAVKSVLSHRARAARQFVRQLLRLARESRNQVRQ